MPAMRTVTLIASPTVSQALNHRTNSTAPESPPMTADPGHQPKCPSTPTPVATNARPTKTPRATETARTSPSNHEWDASKGASLPAVTPRWPS